MLEAARGWAANVLANDPSAPRLLVLCGDNGIGKTSTLRGLNRMLKALRIAAWSCGWWKLGPPSLQYACWSLWANLDPAHSQEETMALEDLWDADILLLDDIGAECDRYKSGLALSNLTVLLEKRAHKWTAVTCNYLPELWVGTEAVPGRFGKRAGDRLFRNSQIVPLRHTPSWSTTKGKQT